MPRAGFIGVTAPGNRRRRRKGTAPETRLVMTIETTTPDETFTMRFRNLGTYSGIVDMGDGSGPRVYSSWNDPAFTFLTTAGQRRRSGPQALAGTDLFHR